jgi:hypothetical protein
MNSARVHIKVRDLKAKVSTDPKRIANLRFKNDKDDITESILQSKYLQVTE